MSIKINEKKNQPNSYLMDGQERMEKEMIRVKSKPLAPVGDAGPEKEKEPADLFEIGAGSLNRVIAKGYLEVQQFLTYNEKLKQFQSRYKSALASERGDVPGWVLVVLMTTGLVTAIWTIAAPRLTSILKNSLDAMNGIR